MLSLALRCVVCVSVLVFLLHLPLSLSHGSLVFVYVCVSVHVDCVCVLKLGGWKMVGERGRVKRHSMYIEERERESACVGIRRAISLGATHSARSSIRLRTLYIY